MTREILRNRVVQTSLILLLAGSALTGCGDDGGSSEPDPSPAPSDAEAIEENAGSGPSFSVEYYENGTRNVGITTDGYSFFSQQNLIEWCDGGDKYSLFSGDDGKAGGAGLEISTEHPACEDGQLTPEDFALPR